MKKIDIVRAWRDEEYRNSLTAEELASLPENPAGLAYVSDSVLSSIAGGCGYKYSSGCGTPGGEVSTPNQSCVGPNEICP